MGGRVRCLFISVTLVPLIALGAAGLSAQQIAEPTAPMSFEAASVKPPGPNDPVLCGMRGTFGRIQVGGFPMSQFAS